MSQRQGGIYKSTKILIYLGARETERIEFTLRYYVGGRIKSLLLRWCIIMLEVGMVMIHCNMGNKIIIIIRPSKIVLILNFSSAGAGVGVFLFFFFFFWTHFRLRLFADYRVKKKGQIGRT